ncbi:MAG: hypothetical protein ACLPX5_10520 [Dissulfurispiraceae bacterium]
MVKRLIDVLRVLARELINDGYDADDIVEKISMFDIDFLAVEEALSAPEVATHIDDAELDTIKVLLAYILIRDSDLEIEEIYSFVFAKGKQLVWH